MAKYLIVDPPAGWMYGFPKVLMAVPEESTLYNTDIPEEIYRNLLSASKYPDKDVAFALEHSRYWISS